MGGKGSHGWSGIEKYERVLGVCILDWGRPLSDRERCGCTWWWSITSIRGSCKKWMDRTLDMSQYFQQGFPLPSPLSFIFIWKHEQMWGKQQISAVWLLACTFQLITDEQGGLVVPNYQRGGSYRAWLHLQSRNAWCSHPAVLFFPFLSKMLNLNEWLIFSSHMPPKGGKKHLSWNTGFILYKLQESCRAAVLITSSMPLNLERNQQG